MLQILTLHQATMIISQNSRREFNGHEGNVLFTINGIFSTVPIRLNV